MKDVAAAAGVSTATVSHVVNGVGRFSEETRDRVMAAVRELGYVTNQAARNLRISRSQTVALVVPDITNDFFAAIALHLERDLAGSGWSVYVCNSGNDAERERDYLASLVSRQVDGIACISGQNRLPDGLIPPDTPVVCIDRAPESTRDVPHVGSDERTGGRLATGRLIATGCRRIAYISSYTAEYDTDLREAGFREALLEGGIDPHDCPVLHLSGRSPAMQEAETLVSRLIREGRAPDGVFASNDPAAVGALRAFQGAGITVPGEARVVGFDDSVYAGLTTPRLTTVHRFPEQLAQAGHDVLVALMKGRSAPLRTTVPVELVVRESA